MCMQARFVCFNKSIVFRLCHTEQKYMHRLACETIHVWVIGIYMQIRGCSFYFNLDHINISHEKHKF